jgi:hypothetical protein
MRFAKEEISEAFTVGYEGVKSIGIEPDSLLKKVRGDN